MKRLIVLLSILLLIVPSVYGFKLKVGTAVGWGTSTPTKCNIGDLFIDTDDDILYMCKAVNTWQAAGGGVDYCLESVFGTGLEADDLELSGTDLQLAAERPPHTMVRNRLAGSRRDMQWRYLTIPILLTQPHQILRFKQLHLALILEQI